MTECKLAHGCLIEGGCEPGREKCDVVTEVYDLDPLPNLETMKERPYYISQVIRLHQPITSCFYGYHIEGPGWPPGRMWVGTTELCGEHLVNSMNMAYNWGVRKGKQQ
jgi:hypothetical protein